MAENNGKEHADDSRGMMGDGAHPWHKVSPLRLLVLFLLLIAAFWVGVKFGQVSAWGGYGYYGMPMMRGWGFGSYPGYYMGPGMMGPWYYNGLQQQATTSVK